MTTALSSTRPYVSVGLPVFNGQNFVDEALRSLRNQSLRDIEIIVADNASDDMTMDIVRRHAAEDGRIRILTSEANRGATWNYNRLVEQARGRFFKWAAHDDVCLPTFLERCVQALDAAGPSYVLAYPKTMLIDEYSQAVDPDFVDGLGIDDERVPKRLARYVRHPGEQHAVFGVMRLDVLRQTLLIRPCWGGDIPLLAEMLMRGRFVELPERLFLRRYHAESSMVANRTHDDIAAWFDPTQSGRPQMPRTRLLWELTTAVLRFGSGHPPPVFLAGTVAFGWTRRYWRTMGGEVKIAARLHAQGLSRRSAG